MCKTCGICDHEPVYNIDDLADWIYNDVIFGKTDRDNIRQ